MYVLITLCIGIVGLVWMVCAPNFFMYFMQGNLENHSYQEVFIAVPFFAGIVIVCALLAASPVGEWIVRLSLGARKMVGRELEILRPIIYNLKAQVAAKGKTIHVRAYIVDDPFPMSYAIGKSTIVVTSGLLKQTGEAEIAGGLAHEFGHLYFEDTKRSLAQWGALLPLLLYYKLWMIFINFLYRSESIIGIALGLIFHAPIFPLKLLLDLWALIGRRISRKVEYRADAFAAELGEHDGLIRLLERYSEIDHQKWGLAEQLMATHPPTMYRIGKLENIE